MAAGCLYLVPTLLGAVAPESVLPARTLEHARALRHFVAENAKPARAFLKAIGTLAPIQDIAIAEIDAHTPGPELQALLAPALGGSDLGLLSDAGCPAVADPGARLVAAAHRAGIRVVPLVGPSSLLLALMASGMNGQGFTFHGYLPSKPDVRTAALRRLEQDARRTGATQLFIETPYRNPAMIEALATTCSVDLLLGVAVDLTLPTEEVVVEPAARWQECDVERYRNRPAIFMLGAPEPPARPGRDEPRDKGGAGNRAPRDAGFRPLPRRASS